MLLAVDSGNTNVVFAVFDDAGDLRGEWRASTNVNRTADEFWVWLTHLMAMARIDRGDIHDAIIATVVPATLFSIKLLCRKYLGVEPKIVGEPDVELGMQILVDMPSEVGADRLVNAVAAHRLYGGPLIVIDFGTATTFDVVDAAGNYCGGVIAPGINLSIDALQRAAAKLPPVAIARPRAVIGRSTVSAMQSGIYWGYIGLIEGVVGRISREYEGDASPAAPMRVIATGGLAPLFADATDVIQAVDLDLTLRGLYLVHSRVSRS
jgi:type III pantothenate kinase